MYTSLKSDMAKRKTRRGNRTFTDPEGDIWDSRFEWLVYIGLRDSGQNVRRCHKRDTLTYHTPVKQGLCLECRANSVVQVREYTPDLLVAERKQGGDEDASGPASIYYVECKGYFPKERRSQLVCLSREWPDLDLRFLFAKEAKLTPTCSNVEYVLKYMKKPAGTWNDGALEWRYP